MAMPCKLLLFPLWTSLLCAFLSIFFFFVFSFTIDYPTSFVKRESASAWKCNCCQRASFKMLQNYIYRHTHEKKTWYRLLDHHNLQFASSIDSWKDKSSGEERRKDQCHENKMKFDQKIDFWCRHFFKHFFHCFACYQFVICFE